MIWLLWNLISFPVRLLFGTAKVGAKTGYRTGRLFGYRRMFVLGLGIVIGLLIAPMSGAKLREKLKAAAENATPDPAEQIRSKLSHDPRTWHLPQPEVEVIGERVVLRGSVPHDTGRADLEAVARTVAGISAVDNRLNIADAV